MGAVYLAIGFGISTPEQAQRMAGLSHGAIVGSAIIKLLAQYGKDAPQHIGAHVWCEPVGDAEYAKLP